MRLLFILALCLLNHILFSQVRCQGVLTDSLTKEPLEFANIGIPGKGLGTVTNEKGEFTLVVPDSLASEKVKISLVGYKARTLSVKRLNEKGRLYLAPANRDLKEVSVSAKKLKIKILGNETRTKAVSAGVGMSQPGGEIAVKLHVKHPGTHLRKFCVNINQNKGEKALFRLNLYEINEKGEPGNSLLDRNIIVEPAEKEGFVEFDLKPYNLYVDKDVFVSIELIKDLQQRENIFFSAKLIGSSPTYFRFISQDDWEKVPVGVGLFVEAAY